MKRVEASTLLIAKRELRNFQKDRATYYGLLSLSIISLCLLLLISTLHVLDMTGYASVTSRAGYITTVVASATFDIDRWGGFYGLALRVPGFSEQLDENLPAGSIIRSDVFFDCMQTDSRGGPQVFASNSSTVNLLTDLVLPAPFSMINAHLNCSGKEYCAENTFTINKSIYIGETEIENVPFTWTFKAGGITEAFDIGALNVSNELVFVTHVNSTFQFGYNPNRTVNYQMLLPVRANTTDTYYFYTDPYDVCPQGGIGNSLNVTLGGYVLDSSNNSIEGATVYLAGYLDKTNASGYYNVTAEVLEGTFTAVAEADGYQRKILNVTFNATFTGLYRNITLEAAPPEEAGVDIITPRIYGTVRDTGSNLLSGVNVSLGNVSSITNSSGQYSFRPGIVPGVHVIVGIKTDYDNYVDYLEIPSNTTTYNYNFSMAPANLNQFVTGPFTSDGVDDQEGDSTQTAQQEAEDIGQDFWISTSEINRQVRENTFSEDSIDVYNFRDSNMQLVFGVSGDIEDIVTLDQSSLTVPPGDSNGVTVTITGTRPIGIYRGLITISGDLSQEIPVRIEIVPNKLQIESLAMEIELFRPIANPGKEIRYRLNLQNLLTEQGYTIELKHLLLNPNGTRVFYEEDEIVEIDNSLSLLKDIPLEENFTTGEYLVSAEARYLSFFSSVAVPVDVSLPFYLYSFFGIPLWVIFLIISVFSFGLFNFYLYQKHLEKKKRFHTELRLDLLPKPGERSIKLGKIAETKVPAYYNIDDLTTHMIVAGATGGGKSISAQVFVEEMLEKKIAVIVFDPTAQWSGMLRKNEDKKMMSFYPKFGLKPTDAKSYAGSVRQITNHLQSVDINKYLRPGQIQVFTLNKLDPQQIDIFVAGVISNIFKSDPKEHPGLQTLLVFDEVHRLLPKFGGSGKGFLQIERACREFRKWGLGVMLVSQVLSDFVGEIKANINTEVQMRVAEENDLQRIKERYGLDALKSLVRADVGTGMLQNAEYNKGQPYFVNMRPILHSTRRLTDEVLEKYNNYNDKIDDLEYQIEQLEELKVDTFDLKMELKLVKDKLMTGNFTVVDIYLEGLGPRLEKQWQALGKKPQPRKEELINVAELENALQKAQADRKKWKEKEGGGEGEEKKEEKKEDISAKIVKPITFDNGMMVSSLRELKDVLPTLDASVFAIHVNAQKNEIADWAGKEIDPALGTALKGKKKDEMIPAIDAFISSKNQDGQKGNGAPAPNSEGAQPAQPPAGQAPAQAPPSTPAEQKPQENTAESGGQSPPPAAKEESEGQK